MKLYQCLTMTSICSAAILFQAFLTVKCAPQADKVVNLPGQPHTSFQQYAGYIKVDEKQQRALFYYFVEAETEAASKPLVLWLNGGPGCSSVGKGGFHEHGPFKPSGNILLKNEYSWNRVANLLYLDSPAGVGFSYSANESFYASITDEITARDNLAFLESWFTKFPEYKNRDFFITGESYAGHYVPQLAQLIIQSNMKFQLKGIALGNPVLEYNTDFNSRAGYLWSHGLLSDSTFESLTSVCNYSQIIRQIQSGSLTPACSEVASLVSREISRFVNIRDVTLDACLYSLVSQSSMLNKFQDEEELDFCTEDELVQYLNRKDVHEALHAQLVGVTEWIACTQAIMYDPQDLEVPTIHVLGDIIKSKISVLVYSGDQDSVIPFTGTRTLINGLAEEIGLQTTVPYRVWFEGSHVAGWTQVYGDILSFATIRGASHDASFSQPKRSLALFKAFLAGKPLPEALLFAEKIYG